MLLNKRYVYQQPPISTYAMSVYPYSEELVHLYSFKTPFDEDVCGVVKNGAGSLLVPRESVPYALKEDYRVSFPPVAINCNFIPRHEQQELCEQSIHWLQLGRSHIFEAPTAWGKTVAGGYIGCRMGQPTLIIVTKEDLLEQWRKSLVEILKVSPHLIGHIQQNVCDYKNRMFVLGMVHSLIIPDRYPADMYKYFGLVEFDEVHQMAADCFIRSCQMFPAKYRLGFSATPERKDGKTKLLNWHIGPTLVRGTVKSMKPKILVKKTHWKIPARKKLIGNTWQYVPIPYAPGRMMLVNKAMASSEHRNLEIVNFVVQAYQAGRRCLVLSDLREHHLNRLFQMFTSYGIPGNDIGYYVGGMSKVELELNKKRKVILATYKMAATGTDVPIWDTLIMVTPRSDIKQPLGRVTRVLDGKKQPVIVDLVDEDSILQNFHMNRLKQYYELGCEIFNL